MEKRKSLLQAGIVLVVIMVLIGFVVGSDANSFCTGIISIIKGICNTILFIIGLAISLVLSVAILIGIYLVGLFFYSKEQANKTYTTLIERIGHFYECYIKKQCSSLCTKTQATETKTYKYSAQSVSTTDSDDDNTAILEISDDEWEDAEHKDALREARAEIEGLKEEIRLLKESQTAASIETVGDQEKTEKKKEIQDKVEYDLDHRLFFYIEKDDDKTAVANAVIEAVEREMTYGEADTHLSASLRKDLDTIVKEHPSLTKDFIRSCKKILAKKQQ